MNSDSAITRAADARHARHEEAAVGARPAVERLRVPEHGEVVHVDDDRDRARASGARKLGQCSTSSPRARRGSASGYQQRVPRDRRRAARTSPGDPLDVDQPLEVRQQPEQVARGAGPRLTERRDVDADSHARSLASASRVRREERLAHRRAR